MHHRTVSVVPSINYIVLLTPKREHRRGLWNSIRYIVIFSLINSMCKHLIRNISPVMRWRDKQTFAWQKRIKKLIIFLKQVLRDQIHLSLPDSCKIFSQINTGNLHWKSVAMSREQNHWQNLKIQNAKKEDKIRQL